MKNLIYIIAVFLLTSCKGQTTYFQATGITDKTKELSIINEWTPLKDKERVDGYTRIGDSIFGGEIACNIKPLKDIDLKTFKVWPGTKYAKDKNHVYYPIDVYCKDYNDCGVCFFGKIIVENANPASFRYLTKDYATDGHNVFFRGLQILGADGVTFKVVDAPEYLYFATDKLNVYKRDKIFVGPDPATFNYPKNDPRNTDAKYKFIITDKDRIWEYSPPDSIKEISK